MLQSTDPTCFVIQPFDRDVFDKRFQETYAPSIRAAGMVPYRVDQDPGASIPIEAIENGIKAARVCFADVSLDNPNVWFELGYAIAAGKDLCIVCEKGRPKFPFDVQHRQIIEYSTKASSDFVDLQGKITDRLSALMQKNSTLLQLAQNPIKQSGGLSEVEIVVLCTIVENMLGTRDSAAAYSVAQDVERIGYNRLAFNVGVRKLEALGLIAASTVRDDFETYTAYRPSDSGWNWMAENEALLNFRKVSARTTASVDDQIPF